MKSTLLFSILVVMISLTGCASSGGSLPVTPTSSPVPTHTATPIQAASSTSIPLTPTFTPGGAIPHLPAPFGQGFLLSPEGSPFIEWTTQTLQTIELFNFHGQLEGHYDSPNGMSLHAEWLPDSSGVFLWTEPSGLEAKPGPIVLMDQAGQVHSIGMDGINPERSPDGKWIAATVWGEPSGPDGVELVSTAGGPVLEVVQGEGARFLGWNGTTIIYFAPGGIYSIPGGGGSGLLLIPFSPDEYVDLDPNPIYSPDGRVVLVTDAYHKEFTLALDHPRLNSAAKLPVGSIDMASLHSWAPPLRHDTVGFSSPTGKGPVVGVDMATGTFGPYPGIVLNMDQIHLLAVSGNWLAWSSAATGRQIHFTDLLDGTSIDLGKDAPDIQYVFSTGSDFEFFLYDVDGNASVIRPNQFSELYSNGAFTPAPDTCGPWGGTDGSVGAALSQKYGELRNCLFFDNSWIILTLGLQGQSGIVAVYRCASTDAACLNGQTDHPLAGWTIYVPPCKGGETLGPESDPSTGKIQILGGCEQWFDVSTGTFSVRYYSTP